MYEKVNGCQAYLYRAVDSRGYTLDFYLPPRRNSKAAYRYPGKRLNNVKTWQSPRFIDTDKVPTYDSALSRLKREGKSPSYVEHHQIKHYNNVIECDDGKLKIKQTGTGLRQVMQFYDPNWTTTHKRVAVSGSDLSAIERLTAADFIEPERLNCYCRTGESVTVFFDRQIHVLRNNDRACADSKHHAAGNEPCAEFWP